MAVTYIEQEGNEPLEIELREPHVAALLAWLVPGAGHLYQRRYAKGALFMICILSIFIYGLALGGGRCVYASTGQDFRWQYFFQIGAGAVTFPALVQNAVTKDGSDPFFVLCERYPGKDQLPHALKDKEFEIIGPDDAYEGPTYKDGFMAPPPGPLSQDSEGLDVLAMWHRDMKQMFDVGTLFTIVAGLLNMLVVYDAYAGPMIISPSEKKRREKVLAKSNREADDKSEDASNE
jgi:hypothetical protein